MNELIVNLAAIYISISAGTFASLWVIYDYYGMIKDYRQMLVQAVLWPLILLER